MGLDPSPPPLPVRIWPSTRAPLETTLCNTSWDIERIVCCSVLQCVAVCCSVLQCVAVCCSVRILRYYLEITLLLHTVIRLTTRKWVVLVEHILKGALLMQCRALLIESNALSAEFRVLLMKSRIDGTRQKCSSLSETLFMFQVMTWI